MKNYLSFGGGVNSVALHLLLLEQGVEFESVFVHHGTDWPETYQYVAGFQWWLKANGHKPITIINATVHRKKTNETFTSLVDYCEKTNRIPQQFPRWCSGDWKKDIVSKYVKKPCWMHIGIDAGESHRAKIQSKGQIEYRWLLIESGIDREGCRDLIKKHGLPVPRKSGCFICPFQTVNDFRELKIKHPDLFCKAKQLEKASGRTLKKIPLPKYIEEDQMVLFEQDEYPPCNCGL